MKRQACIGALLFAAGVCAGGFWTGVRAPAWAVPDALASENGDTNGDGKVNISDPVYLLMYLFSDGPAPVACRADTTILYLVRHGERAGEELSELGHVRAAHLADLFAGMHIDSLIATDARRTQQTLTPLLESKENLTEIEVVQSFDQGVTTLEAIDDLPPGSRAVIASHSTEIDNILRGLGATDEAFGVSEYDRLWVVTIREGEDAEAVELKYCVAPDCPVLPGA